MEVNWSKYPEEPYAHQREIVEGTWDKPYWGLFCEMGTGKSFAAIATMVELYLAGHIDTVLYVAKKGELANFSTYEVPKHLPASIDLQEYVYNGYTRKADQANLVKILTPSNKLRLFSINIESIRSGKPFEIALKYVKSSKKVLVIVDESTTMKSPKSTQTKKMLELRKHCKFRRIMTGTVVSHSPVDVWSQARFLNPDALGYRSITAFKAQYLIQEIQYAGNRRYMAVIGSKNHTDLQARIRTFATIKLKEECLDLPEKIYQRRMVELTPEQKKVYNDLVDFNIHRLSDGSYISAVNALSVMTKLHQVVCGQVVQNFEEEDRVYHEVACNRPAQTCDLIWDMIEAGNETKFVVWSHFRMATEMLKREMIQRKLQVVHLEAGLTIPERQSRINEFKTNKNVQVFLANPQSSGFGITLTESATTIYYSNSDNYEHRLQSEDRVHRIGQDRRCLYIDMHTPGTVEDKILDRKLLKEAMRDGVLSTEDFKSLVLQKVD